MATTNTNGTKRSRSKGAAEAAPSSIVVEEKINAATQMEQPAQSTQEKRIRAARKKSVNFNLDDSILVRNGFHGTLVIKLPKAGYTLKMQEYGDEDYIEVADLRALRNAQPKYFKKNWILFDDPDIIEYLHMEEFYKNTLSIDGIEDLFVIPIDEAVSKIEKLTDGQKKTVMYTAMEKIDNKQLGDLNRIHAFEKALGVPLMEYVE